MSEEALEVDNTETPDDPPEMSAAEEKARGGGWKPESEWEEDDPKKPREFASAEEFNIRGEFIGRIKDQDRRMSDMETQFNTRADNMNKLHKQQIDSQRADLISKRDDAIDLADREGANKIQDQIDNLAEVPESTPADTGQTALDAWNAKNRWAAERTPKAAYAQALLADYVNQGMSYQDALTAIDTDIAREFPDINADRDNHPSSEGGSKPGVKRQARKLTMSDLTPDELKQYRAMPGAWKSDAEFLQTVQDIRSES